MKINVLTVNYETEEFIINLINKLNEEKIEYELIVVNNSSEKLSKCKNVKIVKNNLKIKNGCLSHVSGLNLGLSNLNFKNKYTLICDPDINFTKGVIKELIEYMGTKKLDVIGIPKYYPKDDRSLMHPYVWFTIIKTELLMDFYFLYMVIDPNILVKLIRKICRIMKALPELKDSGDSIYELIKTKNLKYEIIPPIKKQNLIKEHQRLKDVNSTEWMWDNKIISHFGGGSVKRIGKYHKEYEKKYFFRI